MRVTSEEVIDTFQKYCDEYNKIFIPEPRQEGIVENLIRFYEKNYDGELLLETIKYYIRGVVEETVQVYDFAIVSGKAREKALADREDRNEIAKLMKQTQETMKGLK